MTLFSERLRRLSVPPDGLVFFGLGQAGVVIRGPDAVLCIDPYLSDFGGEGRRLDRLFPPPLQPTQLAGVEAVLVTHGHVDHFDPETLGPLASASPRTVFVAPYSCEFGPADSAPARLLRPSAFEPLTLATARVTPVPSAHTGLDIGERGYPYLGYLIEWNGVTVYHSGDTVIYDGDEESSTPALLDILKRWSIDVMFVPINGRDYFRSAEGLVGNTCAREAAELAERLDVKLIIPTHYDLLAGNGANPAHFVDTLYRLNPSRAHHLLRPGELYCFLAGIPS